MPVRNKILLSTAIFIAAMFGGDVYGQNSLLRVNTEIAQTRNSIDSVRNTHERVLARKVRRCRNYQYIHENAEHIDALRDKNENLMNRAINLIHKKYPVVFVVRNSAIFVLYKDVPGISVIRDLYYQNMHAIREYERRVAEFRPEYQKIKNECDSVKHAKIDMYQMRLDSLLNVKQKLIHQK